MKCLFFLILLLLNQECNSQKLKIKNENPTMQTINVNNTSEVFSDLELLLSGNKTPIDNKGNYDYNYYNDNFYIMGQPEIYYASIKYFPGTNYALKKIYHGNGNIKEKGAFFNGNENTKLGMWYEYDSNGKLIKEINYDEGYKYSFEDVLLFCELKKIAVIKGDIRKLQGGFYTQIIKDTMNGRKVWIIKYQDGKKPSENIVTENGKVLYKSIYEELILDGATGKLISSKTINDK